MLGGLIVVILIVLRCARFLFLRSNLGPRYSMLLDRSLSGYC
jgi:hypothetical protein